MKRGTRTRPEKKMKEERQQQAEVARAIGQVWEEEDRARHSFVRARVQDLPQTPRGGEGRGKQILYYIGAEYYRPESRRTSRNKLSDYIGGFDTTSGAKRRAKRKITGGSRNR
jgi:hypothetical protein